MAAFILMAAALTGATVASAVVTPVGSPEFGVEPHSVTPFTKEPKLPLAYHGGPVMHSSAIYAIYWDPARSVSWNYDGDWVGLVDEYFQALAQESGKRSNVFAVATQYNDSSGHRVAYNATFRGAYTDVNPYPASGGCVDPTPEAEKFACLTDAQLRTELSSFISAHGLPTGTGALFFMLTPPGVTVCTDAGGVLTGHCSDSAKKDPWAKEAVVPSPEEVVERESYKRSFCSYHSYIGPQSNPIVYAVQPWTAGNLAMFLPTSETLGTVSGSDCQDGSGMQQEPNQKLELEGLDTDGDFDTGLADVIINQLSVEQIAAETNPLLNAWYAPSSQSNAGNEVTDQCRNVFAAVPMGGKASPPEHSRTGAGTLSDQSLAKHAYYLNNEYNQAALSMDYPGIPCLPAVALVPQFTLPTAVNSSEVVGFDASESDISLDGLAAEGISSEVFPTYTWDFGDGTHTTSSDPPGASLVDEPSAFHTYQYGGTYTVTLTVTDVGGNVATVSHTLGVDGPLPPPPPMPQPPSTPSNAAAGTATASPTSGTATSTATGTAVPTVYDHVASHSLKKVLRYGLSVRYSVNEQVAGAMQVMLDSRTAKRLRIRGMLAKGLPKGYPRQIVLGGAVLVTTTAGKGTMHMVFPRPLAEKLAHAGRLKLTLRIVVRNADRLHPRTTTLLSTVVLKG